LRRRLWTVQAHIRAALETAPPGRLRVVSACAGQGGDLLGVLAEHRRRDDVSARLVELDSHLAALAEQTAESMNLGGIEVVVGDAGLTSHYRSIVPADLVLLCGVFGNLTDQDVERTVAHCPQLCKTGGTLICTRHRRPPDLVPRICRWLQEQGFQRHWLSDPQEGWSVGVHRFTGDPQPLDPDRRMFTFVGSDAPTQPDGPA
jgi:SAM-dependent methyltransferase